MTRNRMFNPFALASLFLALLLTAAPSRFASAKPPAQPGETPGAANEFIDRFIGSWLGEGDFAGTPVHESFECARVLGGNFLLMKDREIGGAGFEGDIYLGYDALDKRYELTVFTNFNGFGAGLPFRQMTGQRSGDTLVMEERHGRAPLRYTFEFLDQDTFRFTKAFVKGHNVRTIVVEVFSRQPA